MSVKVIRFGNFCFDAEGYLLWHNEKPVSLTPKLIGILSTLLSHKGRVVTKQSLLTAVWPNTFVEENNLNWNIHMLRRKLEESPENKFIMTVPRVGFRFVPQIDESEPPCRSGAKPSPDIQTRCCRLRKHP